MSIPKTTRAFRRTKDGASIELVEDVLPTSLEPNQVFLKVSAVSLNFRDVAMLHGLYPIDCLSQGVPCSDAAATVVAVGSSVHTLKKGDYVSPTFAVGELANQALGGDVDGVLREYAIYDQQFVTKIPEHLSTEEGSLITCAGVTAWNSLNMNKPIVPPGSEFALMEGTGGVSLFSLLICLAAGIKPIITSSSDKKLEQVKALGPKEGDVLGINYKTTPAWEEEAQKLTNGRGVDIVVNNVGATSFIQCFKALKPRGGTVSLVGFLGGKPDQNPDVTPLLMGKAIMLQGISVGTVQDQVDLCEFLTTKKISLEPLIDKVFAFEDSAKAFDYLFSGAHTGKVVIKLD